MCGIRNTLESRYRQFTSYEPQSKIIFPGSQQPLALGTTLARQHSRSSTSATSPRSPAGVDSQGEAAPGPGPASDEHSSSDEQHQSQALPQQQMHSGASAGGRFKRFSGSTTGAGAGTTQFTIDPLDSFICGAYLINLSSSDCTLRS